TSVRVGNDTYRVYESGEQELVYVDGALPWRARVGDRTHYVDLIAPPRMFCVETEGAELDCFEGTYLPARDVYAAFGVEPGPDPMGIHGAQPFAVGPALRWLGRVGLVLGL